jgi:hypothetical protein
VLTVGTSVGALIPMRMRRLHQQGTQGAEEHVNHPDSIAWKSMCATDEGRTVDGGFRRARVNKPIVCFWHLADIQPSSGNVRFWG